MSLSVWDWQSPGLLKTRLSICRTWPCLVFVFSKQHMDDLLSEKEYDSVRELSILAGERYRELELYKEAAHFFMKHYRLKNWLNERKSVFYRFDCWCVCRQSVHSVPCVYRIRKRRRAGAGRTCLAVHLNNHRLRGDLWVPCLCRLRNDTENAE